MIRASLAITGRVTLAFLREAGGLALLAASVAQRVVAGRARGEKLRVRETSRQIVRAGVASLPLVGLIGLLAGMIMALQSAYQLEKLGVVSLIPGLVAVSVVRELSPLLTGIVVTGRYGSAITAELGTMKTSQEIDALTVLGLDPTSYLVVPRVLGLLVAVPCLTVFSNAIGILGGFLVASPVTGQDAAGYFLDAGASLVASDVATSLVKAILFAAVIGLVGCFQGLETSGGAEEVGQATTTSVVRAIALIIAMDLAITALFYVAG